MIPVRSVELWASLWSVLLFPTAVQSYDNEVGLKPALGWNTWCTDYPCSTDVCNQDEIKAIAEAMRENGMMEAGYNRINLDDCWEAEWRDPVTQTIQWDPMRFPDGIPYLADWLHQRGFLFGLYTSAGFTTCNHGERPFRIPGSYGHYYQDAQTFADWGVDYIKLDWCGASRLNGTEQHIRFSNAVNATGRPIWLEICRGYGYPPPAYLAGISQSWRVFADHRDNWESTRRDIQSIIGNTGNSGEYNWAYLDFLMTGGEACENGTTAHCPGMSDEEYRTEFAIWAITASPLIVATDVREMTPIMKEVLLNREILQVNQDHSQPAGDLRSSEDCDSNVSYACQIWSRPLSDDISFAVVLYNAGDYSHSVTAKLSDVDIYGHWGDQTTVYLRDLWEHKEMGSVTGNFTVDLRPHANFFGKLTLKEIINS